MRRVEAPMIPHRTFLIRLAIAALLLAAVAAAAAAERRPKFDTWLSDADGMLEAIRQYEEEQRPILVYFYTDWCGYCRQFERVLLSEDYVEEYLDKIIKVRINPERGPREMQISRQYGVRGYPGIFMHSASSRRLSQVERMEIVDGRPRLMRADAFVDQLKVAGAR